MNRLYAQLERCFVIDLIAFLLGLYCAWGFNWTTTDLVWSLWLSSLVVGYMTIISVIGSGVLIGNRIVQHPEFAAGKRGKPIVVTIGSGVALFLLAFFTFHFCGFHAGHATFLSGFFPLEGIDGSDFGRAFINPMLLWQIAVTQLLPIYGIFLVPMLFAERHALMSPIVNALALGNEIKNDDSLSPGGTSTRLFLTSKIGKREQNAESGLSKAKSKSGNPLNDALVGPYRNVIRMHILIFVFAGLSYFGLESFAVFAMVYAVYFFPFRRVKERLLNPGDVVGN